MGNAAFPTTAHMVSPYKHSRGIPSHDPEERRFNDSVASTRVCIEHTFGMLKSRFQSLTGLRSHIGGDRDFKKAMLWVDTCVVLHNWFRAQDQAEDDDFWTVWEDLEAREEEWDDDAEERRGDQETWTETMTQSGRRFTSSTGSSNSSLRDWVKDTAEKRGYRPAY